MNYEQMQQALAGLADKYPVDSEVLLEAKEMLKRTATAYGKLLGFAVEDAVQDHASLVAVFEETADPEIGDLLDQSEQILAAFETTLKKRTSNGGITQASH